MRANLNFYYFKKIKVNNMFTWVNVPKVFTT